MCSYQNLKYRFIIYNLTSNNHFVVGPKEYSYAKGPHISEVLKLQLVRNAEYSMTITVQTSAGTVTSENITLFSKLQLQCKTLLWEKVPIVNEW